MIKLYEGQKNSIYFIQKKLGLSINTLYNYARKKTSINKMSANMINDIANIEKIEPNLLYEKMKSYLGE